MTPQVGSSAKIVCRVKGIREHKCPWNNVQQGDKTHPNATSTSKRSTDTGLKSAVGLTKFYCQLTSRSQVLAIYLKKFKLVSSISIGSATSVKAVVLKSFPWWPLGTRVELLSLSHRPRAILAVSLPEKETDGSRSLRWLAPHHRHPDRKSSSACISGLLIFNFKVRKAHVK